MPVKLRDYLAQPLSPSVERVTLQGELCEFADALDFGRRLDVAARDGLAGLPFTMIEAQRDGRFRYPLKESISEPRQPIGFSMAPGNATPICHQLRCAKPNYG